MLNELKCVAPVDFYQMFFGTLESEQLVFKTLLKMNNEPYNWHVHDINHIIRYCAHNIYALVN